MPFGVKLSKIPMVWDCNSMMLMMLFSQPGPVCCGWCVSSPLGSAQLEPPTGCSCQNGWQPTISEDQSHFGAPELVTSPSPPSWVQGPLSAPTSAADIIRQTWEPGSTLENLFLRHGALGPYAVGPPVWPREKGKYPRLGLQLMATPTTSGWVIQCHRTGQPLD